MALNIIDIASYQDDIDLSVIPIPTAYAPLNS